MATVRYEDMFPLVQPYVQGCPNVTIETHLAEAAAMFCARTQIWRVDVEEESTVASEPFYDMDIPSGSKLEAMLWFKLNDKDMTLTQDIYEKPNEDEAEPVRYAPYHDNQLRLYPTPDAVYTFSGVAVVKPSRTSSGIEDFIYETHGRTIADGALAKLMRIPDKLWTNLELSEVHRIEFEKGITNARIRDFRNVPLRVVARPFA